MFWCTRAWAKLNFQLFCVWRSQGRRKGDPNINVVGKRRKITFVNCFFLKFLKSQILHKTIKIKPYEAQDLANFDFGGI